MTVLVGRIAMPILSWFSGLWAIAILAVFLWAIRVSYAIERKRGITGWHGLPRRTNLFASAFSAKPSDDAEVAALRRKLRKLLTIVAAGFAVLAAIAFFAMPGAVASI
jgi:hypothetical protein